jgi:hypothetical protein
MAEGGRIELEAAQVHIGITDNTSYEVLEGLKEGDVVAVGSIGGAAPTVQGNNPFGGPFGGRGGRR